MKNTYDYISILGPTGSGKSDLALQLAEVLPIEIVSVDSVSVYQEMDIGSAKPSEEDRRQVPHHLIDVCDLTTVYTVGRFVEDAKKLMVEIQRRGKLPVFCGGSMMYMKALQNGYQMPSIGHETRAVLEQLLEEKGVAYLYGMLQKEDEKMASRLFPNDKQRIIRALTVIRETGRSLCEYWENQGDQFHHKDILLRVNDRDLHRVRLRKRVDWMLEQGLQRECALLLEKYGELEHPALKSIGYKEMFLCLLEKLPTKDVRDKICIASSQFVKRQMSWLNAWDSSTSCSLNLYENGKISENILERMVESLDL